MMNLELKARCPDPDKARQTAQSLPADLLAQGEQTDTYFDVKAGRLKFRESSFDDQPKFIYYARNDSPGPSASDYRLASIRHPENLVAVLTKHYHEKVTVRKKREIYMWDDVRIHIDDVEGLGTFIEFEVPMADAEDEEAARKMQKLVEAFALSEEDFVGESYSDLLAGPEEEA